MQVVYNDFDDDGTPERFCEWKYLQEVIKYLQPYLSDDYVLHIACFSEECQNNKDLKFVDGKKNIIIGTSDEYMKDVHPPYVEQAVAIFKQYLLPHQEVNNVYSFPLGYNKKHILFENRTLAERNIDVFFSGHMASENRHSSMFPVIQFFESLPKEQRPKLEMYVTTGFNQGLDGSTYSEKLHNSKIAICPHGNVSVETFRFYEAIRSGCVVVSPPLPLTEIYKNSNVVQVENWHKDVGSTIMDLLKNEDKLNSVRTDLKKDWNETLCEKAAANLILSKLQK
tara:strand:- start:7771 stop:8616 length:846 start_codon:yes stop_codon:yes gene_type:complete